MEEEVEIIIDDCLVFPMDGDGPIKDGAIAANDGKITYIGKSSKTSKIKAIQKVNAKGKIALPGLVNCHTHVSMTLFQGIAEDQPLDKWLREAVCPYEAKLRPVRAILVEISKPHLRPLHNIYATLVYSSRGSDVDTVIVD